MIIGNRNIPGFVLIDVDGAEFGVAHEKGKLVAMEIEHYELHNGNVFTAYYTRTTAATDGHRSGIYIKTPNTAKSIHMTAEFSCSAAANSSICEGVTIDANAGTHTQEILNRYRDSTNESSALNNATVPAAGYITTLDEDQIASASYSCAKIIRTAPLEIGAGPKPEGASSQAKYGWILKANTAYVFLLTNTIAAANAHYIILDWPEYED